MSAHVPKPLGMDGLSPSEDEASEGNGVSKEELKKLGISRLVKASTKVQPPFCHHWDGTDNLASVTGLCHNDEQNFKFQNTLHNAHRALIHMGLNFATGMPQKAHASIRAGDYPDELKALQPYLFRKGKQLSDEEFQEQLLEYIRIVNERAPTVVKNIERLFPGRKASYINWNDEKEDWKVADGLIIREENNGMWGSRRQWAYGKAAARLLFVTGVSKMKLHSVFASMLNPCGGIVGDSNASVFLGDLSSYLVVHAIVHDAYGYMLSYHSRGPGYNYLQVSTPIPDKSPLCCQLPGLYRAHKIMSEHGVIGDEGRKKKKDQLLKVLKGENWCDPGLLPDDCLLSEKDIHAEFEGRISSGMVAQTCEFFAQILINHVKGHPFIIAFILGVPIALLAWLLYGFI